LRNFRELLVWQKGIDIVVEIYQITALLPNDERYGLKSQLQRAAVSIPSNISEGCSRGTDPAFIKFLEYAIGSAFEIETQLIAVERLGLISKEKLEHINEMVNEEEKMLNGLISSIKGRNQ